MDLFGKDTAVVTNLLPQDGIVNYYGALCSLVDSNNHYDSLIHNIEWSQDKINIYGKEIITQRKVAWYGDKKYQYTYSKQTKFAMPWTIELLALKDVVEKHLNETFNSCLLNLYHNGDEGMGWHSDDEKELKQNAAIASLSFGAARKFSFKHNITGEKISLELQHGSLLVMKGAVQKYWKHALPKTKKVLTPRINLTFRTILE